MADPYAEARVAKGYALPFHALVLGTFLAASSAPTPLYRFYQETYALSPIVTTAVFAVYALALLVALLVAGSLSDHLGRRPVIFGAILLELAAMLLFVVSDGAGHLLAARTVQGIATGIAASSLGAALVDVDRARGQLVNSLAPLLGMAVGALGTSILVQYAPHPLHLVYAILGTMFAVQAVLLWLTAETGARRSGALQSLWPRVVVPPQVRRTLVAVTPSNVAMWMLGGFYLSLVPSLVAVATGTRTPLIGGAMVTALMLSGASAIAARRTRAANANLTVGTFAMMTGLAIVLAGMHGGSVPVLIGGTLLGGAGFGTGFLGALGMVIPLAQPVERAELLAAYYLQSYLALSLPALLAGYLVREIGYAATADIYATTIIATGAVGLFVRWSILSRPAAAG
ncbi:MFS transporter [Methylobacterium sp. PvR107]|uniref:MFS transporter n=1 Tax=Methylobacterium sp. PvR107 TaxID=2806597 RepID=UPI001AE5DB7D|nr:MFS transporter [Methylobacterium sp. PvR107]MBP1183543.1 MFS family permease [Methylobacterium sp. PvR107]